jgi:hypothetical protein
VLISGKVCLGFNYQFLAISAILAILCRPSPPMSSQFIPRYPKVTQESAEGHKSVQGLVADC